MNNLSVLSTNQEQTMNSLDIAELTDKEHKHVMRDIRNMLSELGLGESTFGSSYLSTQNKEMPCYDLPRRECDILVSGYKIKYRAAIVDRWHTLENQNKLPDFTNPYESAIAWAEQYKAKEEALELVQVANHKLAIAKPKVDHYDAVVVRDGLLNATQVGTKFGMSAIKLNKVLAEMKVYNRNVTRSKVFQQWFIDKNYGITRQTVDGYSQSLFTLEGEAWIIEQLISEGIIDCGSMGQLSFNN